MWGSSIYHNLYYNIKQRRERERKKGVCEERREVWKGERGRGMENEREREVGDRLEIDARR